MYKKFKQKAEYFIGAGRKQKRKQTRRRKQRKARKTRGRK
jgi:hypothetical protein